MSEFNFKSQICTTREQSERLLSLGLKKETADMCWIAMSGGHYIYATPWSYHSRGKDFPAWSLHRLIEMIDDECVIQLSIFSISGKVFAKHFNLYDNIVDCIERQIKAGYFPKEYLV